jgi:hypothetical protein
MLCVGCGQFAVFDGKALRKPNVFEDAFLRSDPEMQRIHAAYEKAIENQRHQPIEAKHRALMNKIGEVLARVLPGMGFTLFVFDMNTHDGRMNYLSNVERADMIVALKEWIANEEGRGHDAPAMKQ